MPDKQPQRKKLTDILRANSAREQLSQLWKTTTAAEERGPLPPGEYTFRVLTGELFTSKHRGTPGYKLTLEVAAGENEGRRAWVDFWLTPAALPMTKRDLAKIGITDIDQLDSPLPPGILIRGKLALRHDDDGNESNRLARFECIGTEPGDAFEPKDDATDRGTTPEPAASFPFGANGEPAADAVNAPDRNGEPPAAASAGKRKRSRKKDDAGTKGGRGQ